MRSRTDSIGRGTEPTLGLVSTRLFSSSPPRRQAPGRALKQFRDPSVWLRLTVSQNEDPGAQNDATLHCLGILGALGPAVAAVVRGPCLAGC